jgi:histone deacetylase 6
MPTQAYLLFDERMALHRPIYDPENPDFKPFENADRIFKVYGRLLDVEKRLAQQGPDDDLQHKLVRRFVEFPCNPVSRETVELVHTREHYDWLYHTAFMSDGRLRQLTDPDDLYICQSTFLASSLACGGVVDCVNKVTSDDATVDSSSERKITRAIALVRPPGHHAEADEAMGKWHGWLTDGPRHANSHFAQHPLTPTPTHINTSTYNCFLHVILDTIAVAASR